MKDDPAKPPTTKPPREACMRTANHHVYALLIQADDDLLHAIATAQHLETIIQRNPARLEHPEAPPEQAVMRFGDTEVLILGLGLQRLAERLAAGDLQMIRPLAARYLPAHDLDMFITSITVRRAMPL